MPDESAVSPPAMKNGAFQSFFLGGFECSTHRLRSGRRLDLVRATRHDEFAAKDYRLLQKHGLHTVREGLRWHLIEAQPRQFDFSSAEPIIRAARETGMQVIWDLWHYGWPDDIDIFSAEFIRRFKNFARVATELLSDNFDTLLLCPINEISFFSWAGGEGGIFNPFAQKRGEEMKRQLVRATMEAITAIREVHSAVRFCQIEPIINVAASELRPNEWRAAQVQRESQFETWDMLLGRAAPELGGSDSSIDLIGVNYYIHNQWIYPGGHGSVLVPSDPRYRHVRDMLQEIHARYGKPLFVAETGIEDETRPAWLRYMCNEVYAALAANVPIEGLCLYPILNHPGWEDDRHCFNGLFDYANDEGERKVFEPLG
ncbi:MAG: beta-glucosidase, partial [Pyrinomonadaceae bacterium]|nr:beta-glucosidase [Pyrinomonadaceae bacterium]